jgi:hypothetical protein
VLHLWRVGLLTRSIYSPQHPLMRRISQQDPCTLGSWCRESPWCATSLIAESKQSFIPDKDRTFTLCTAAPMVTIVDPWVNKHRTN